MWSFSQDPTGATDAGIHQYDALLADYSAGRARRADAPAAPFPQRAGSVAAAGGASRHEVVDYLLTRSDIEGDWWNRTVLQALRRNPSIYEGECSNGIFSLVKRQYADDETRLRAAISRLRACPRVLQQGKADLTHPIAEFAQIASEDIRDGDSLYTTTLDGVARDASPATRQRLTEAQQVALDALHAYRAWLDGNMSHFRRGGYAVGRQQYDWYLRRVLMLPFNAAEIASIGRTELARDRALEAWEQGRDALLPSPSPAPTFASKEAFLSYYEMSLARNSSIFKKPRDRRYSAVHRPVSHRRSA